MKRRFRKYGLHISIGFVLAIYLLSFNTLYVRYFLEVGKPSYVGAINLVESEVSYSIDNLISVTYKGEAVYQLYGWAFPKNNDVPLDAYEKQIVLLSEDLDAYFFNAQPTVRQGVTNAYGDLGRDLDYSGFVAYISKHSLELGAYRVGVLYSAPNSTQVFYLTDQVIERTPNTLRLGSS